MPTPYLIGIDSSAEQLNPMFTDLDGNWRKEFDDVVVADLDQNIVTTCQVGLRNQMRLAQCFMYIENQTSYYVLYYIFNIKPSNLCYNLRVVCLCARRWLMAGGGIRLARPRRPGGFRPPGRGRH